MSKLKNKHTSIAAQCVILCVLCFLAFDVRSDAVTQPRFHPKQERSGKMSCAGRRGRKVQGQRDRTNQNLFRQSGWSSTPPRCLTTSPALPADVRAPAGKHSQVTSVCMSFFLPVFRASRMRESYLCSQWRTFNGGVWAPNPEWSTGVKTLQAQIFQFFSTVFTHKKLKDW